MVFQPKEISLKNGAVAVLRSPEIEDAAALLDYLRVTAGETSFLLRYPEECCASTQQEEAFLRGIQQSADTVMILCEVDGKLAGNCSLTRRNRLKTRHRASIGIALIEKYWGLGIGTAMFRELIALAREQGIRQLEPEVFEGNVRAMALYEKMGFRVVAATPNAICLKDGTMLKEYLMILDLS